MPLLTCSGLTLGYEGHAVLSGLSFSLSAGEFLCVVGENGSGKTTLMRTLLGLQKPMAGSISFGEGLRPGEIGYLPQQTAAQKDFPATVWEIVRSGCQARAGLRPWYTREERDLASHWMEEMGISALRRRCYRELSGGQQQRVLLARALCATRLLLLDEPVTGLDPLATEELYSLIRRLHREEGVTILMITHDLEAALRDGTHILHLGGESFFGTVADYLQSVPAARLAHREGGQSA